MQCVAVVVGEVVVATAGGAATRGTAALGDQPAQIVLAHAYKSHIYVQ